MIGCNGCGDCCRILDRMPQDFLDGNGLKHKDGVCLNLVDNECAIYETRPDVCRVSEWTELTMKCCEVIRDVVLKKIQC